MKHSHALIHAIVGFFTLFSCSGPMNTSADLILINGVIYTADSLHPIAEAVAVSGDSILAVGNKEHIEKLAGPSTRRIDLAGKILVPGFIEGHGHFMGLGYLALELDLIETRSYEELIEKVKAATSQKPEGTWIVGRGWHQDKWDSISGRVVSGFPTHHMLSAAAPGHPVFLRHASGHAALANRRAMEIAGIAKGAVFGEGGEVILDADGEPTGIFNEYAAGLIGRHLPPPGPGRDQMAFEKAVETCLRHGVTGFHDAGQSQQYLDVYDRNLRNGVLNLRLNVMLDGSDDALLGAWFSAGPRIDPFLTVRSVKLFADGALGTRGAWLLEPYSDMPGQYGHPAADTAYMEDVADRAIRSGFQICIHAIGDRANREVLDLYERVFTRHPDRAADARFRIEHAQHLHPDDLPRFAALGVIPAMQPIHFASDRPWAIDRLGEARIKSGSYAWQSLLRSGAIVVGGTDVPVEPLNPMDCFYAAVSRKTLRGQPEGGYEPEEALTRQQALDTYTIHAAYASFEEGRKGSVTPGKLADFAVYDRDFMQCPEEEIRKCRVLMTLVGGVVVYGAPELQNSGITFR
jgi:predicted amidohydrolase YtcJ